MDWHDALICNTSLVALLPCRATARVAPTQHGMLTLRAATMSSCAKHVILSASEGSAPSETRGSLPGAPSLTLPGLVSKRRTRTSLRSCGILRFAQDDMVGQDDMVTAQNDMSDAGMT